MIKHEREAIAYIIGALKLLLASEVQDAGKEYSKLIAERISGAERHLKRSIEEDRVP